jgi:hypothetical protein
MNAMQMLNIRELDTNSIEENINKYESVLNSTYGYFKRFHIYNQFANAFFILLPIILTLATAIFAVFGDAVPNQKIWVGILAALSVAVQTVATKFPAAERSKFYLKLRNEIRSLTLSLGFVKTNEELIKIKESYDKILNEESAMP